MQFRFSTAYFFMFLSVGVMSHYGPVFFAGQGYTTFQIGQFVAAAGLMVLPVQPILGILSDKFGAVKKLCVLCLLLCLPTIAGVYLGRNVYIVLMVSYILQMLTTRGAGPLLDSWISAHALQGHAINYNVIRAIAALGISVCGLVVGALLARWGFGAAFIMQAVTLLTCIGILCTIPGVTVRAGRAGKDADDKTSVVGPSPLKNPVFWGAALAIALAYLGHAADATYISVLFMSLGGSESQVGGIIFLQTISEVVVMLLYGRLRKRFTASALMMTSICLYIIRFALVFFTGNLVPLVALQVLQGPTFGLFTPALVEIISRIAGVGHTATAITVAMSLQQGLGTVLGNLIAGYLSQQLGLRAVYGLAVCTCAAGAGLYLWAKGREAKRGGQVLSFKMESG